ncbi:hypothetical protein Taro_014190, partial [Colocasia esculenta]|nr:hypothetical protein [Colocasia esculenta]
MGMEEVCSSSSSLSSFSSHMQVVAEEHRSSEEEANVVWMCGVCRCGSGIWTSNHGGLIGDSLVDANLCDLKNIGEFPTEPVTREAHPYRPTGESEEDVSRPSSSSEPHRSGAGLRPVRGRRTLIKYVIGLTGLAEVFRHSWCFVYVEISGMADRIDWGGGEDDPEESTQRMIERIWESLTDIRARMDQQASVPPVAVPPRDGENVPVASVPPRVEVIGSPESRFSTWFSLPLAPASCPHVPKASNRLRPVRGRRTRIKYVIGLTGLAEAFRHIAPVESQQYALCLTVNINGTRVSQCLVDTEASINVVSLDTLNLCEVALQLVWPSSITITAYDNTSRPPKGVVTLKVGLGPSITEIDFHILDMDPSFWMIMGRPFIQALGVVTSTIHQCLKFPYKGRVVKVASKPTILEVDAMTDNFVPSIWPSNQPLMS